MLNAVKSTKLVDDWHLVLAKAWSVRLMVMSGAAQGAGELWSQLSDYFYVPPVAFVGVSIACLGLGIAARVIVQRNMP